MGRTLAACRTDLRTVLLAHAPLVALVGERVYLVDSPEEAGDPHVVVSLGGGLRTRTGHGHASSGPVTVTVAAVSLDPITAANVADKAFDALTVYAGGIPGSGIKSIEHTGIDDVPNMDIATPVYIVADTYEIRYQDQQDQQA